MDSEDFPKLGPIFQEIFQEQLKQELPETLFGQMEVAFDEMFRLCKTQEDKSILNHCLRTNLRGKIPIRMPKARAVLKVHQSWVWR